MDVRAHRSSRRSVDGRSSSKHQDLYVVHFLALDGTVATLERTLARGCFQLTVEARDGQATRRIAASVARNRASPEFARVIAEMKAELLRAGGRRPAH